MTNTQILENNVQLNIISDDEDKSKHTPNPVAAIDIAEGDIVEQFPFVTLPWRTRDRDSRVGMLHSLSFTKPCECMECSVYGTSFIVSSGYSPMYKHSETPNTKILFPDITEEDRKNKVPTPAPIGIVIAIQDIKQGEDLTLDYSKVYSPAHPLVRKSLPTNPGIDMQEEMVS